MKSSEMVSKQNKYPNYYHFHIGGSTEIATRLFSKENLMDTLFLP